MRYCTKCGAEMSDDSKFCAKCGSPLSKGSLSGYSSSGVSANESGKSKKMIFVGGGAAVVLAVVIFVVSIGHKSNMNTSTENKSNMRYTAGVYTSSIHLIDNAIDVEVVVDDSHINSISLVNLDEATAAMYPLIQPALDNLSQQIYEKQSLENISYGDDNQYTSMVLLQAIQEALDKAAGADTNTDTEESTDMFDNWGLSFQKKGRQPIGNATTQELAKYSAFYVQDTQDKVIYLTFNCEYENGNTQSILDALKKHNAQATFFIVGNYLTTNSEIVKRMVEEGHMVGNQSYHHPDMSGMSQEEFSAELRELETLYEQTIGTPMTKYYRPPQGKYSENSLQLAKDLGYKTIFWSLAYADWNQDSQPTHEEAFDKLLSRVHPGAIALLHNTSKTNSEIMDELLTKWEEMGYTFKSLSELTES